ncbi:MAG: 16S rRNA (cytosine(1402)-N(4))-methyltransferase RsmH [Acidimicrobiales bacterium]
MRSVVRSPPAGPEASAPTPTPPADSSCRPGEKSRATWVCRRAADDRTCRDEPGAAWPRSSCDVDRPGVNALHPCPGPARACVDLLRNVPGGLFVDLTVGAAGHAEAVLEAHSGLRLLGIDRDRSALAAAATRLDRFGDRVQLQHARSDELGELLGRLPAPNVVAILADLGVSSPQLDRPERGFSYRPELDGPLDMRMDPSTGPTAAEIVNDADVGELIRILREYGDERYARRIAQAVHAARPVTTTAQLAELVKEAIPAPARRRGGHPAKRSFQAIRIAVNDELAILSRTLDHLVDGLAPGGRGVVISYQSGEDRLVKARFRLADDGGCSCPPGLPCACGAEPVARLLKRGAWTAPATEVSGNPRAESARLRAIEKLTPRELRR